MDPAVTENAKSGNSAAAADWTALEDIDIATAQFPARAKLGEETIVVLKSGSGYVGSERTCPHQKGNMMNAVLQSNGSMIRCTRHNYVFRAANGKPVNCPGLRLRTFEIKEDNGRLFGRPSASD
jgi:nitrite reductase/ring-hydroxylating ferredoxin subunit